MAREEFIDSLRRASRLLVPSRVSSGQGAWIDALLGSTLHSTDLWLTPQSVEGFDPADFADWPDAAALSEEVTAFLETATQVPANKPASKAQSKQARMHLERACRFVGRHLLHEWLVALERMMDEAAAAAKAKDWYVEKDQKEIVESLLGAYKAPRLRVRTPDKGVVLDPISCFGSGRRGIVDLVELPTYETAYFIIFKDGAWQITSPRGRMHSRPFTQATFANTITRLSPHHAAS